MSPPSPLHSSGPSPLHSSGRARGSRSRRAAATAQTPTDVPTEFLSSEEDRLGWIRDNASLLGNTRPHLVGSSLCANLITHGYCFKGNLCWFRHSLGPAPEQAASDVAATSASESALYAAAGAHAAHSSDLKSQSMQSLQSLQSLQSQSAVLPPSAVYAATSLHRSSSSSMGDAQMARRAWAASPQDAQMDALRASAFAQMAAPRLSDTPPQPQLPPPLSNPRDFGLSVPTTSRPAPLSCLPPSEWPCATKHSGASQPWSAAREWHHVSCDAGALLEEEIRHSWPSPPARAATPEADCDGDVSDCDGSGDFGGEYNGAVVWTHHQHPLSHPLPPFLQHPLAHPEAKLSHFHAGGEILKRASPRSILDLDSPHASPTERIDTAARLA